MIVPVALVVTFVLFLLVFFDISDVFSLISLNAVFSSIVGLLLPMLAQENCHLKQ